ncbi:hypothetical protein [Parasitella parasitica]|uniref:Zn(2)-C6 fungal-type domain-containing protein n=1 Tax=Parasitella parasitica TaxID=35722 RepID=A0A0B7MY77_9FUNG|nr:hypothetical protein [Parasitella parasitica]
MESNSYYNLLNSISEDDAGMPADGLVYNHLQQTLQVQTDMKNQQRIQDFLNSASNDSLLDFDELYSSVTCESDLSYLQMMEQTSTSTPFYTPTEPFVDTTTFDMTCLPPLSGNSVAGLDAELDTPQQQLLCHPLSLLPEKFTGSDVFPCDYYLHDQDMLSEFNCNNTFDSNNYFDQIPASSFMPSLMPYSLPSIHKTAAPISAISNEHRLAYRSNSTPMLSASYSYSSFSSASSNEEESPLQESLDQDKQQTDKQTSMGYTSELGNFKNKSRASMLFQRKNSINNFESDQKKPKQKKASISSSSDSLSYYLARQQLSDTDDYEEEVDQEPRRTLKTSSSTSAICKKGRNVDKACNHCKRSHLRCDNVRPCRRCVSTGKVGCQDVKHKPRGRPRLQKKPNSVPLL